MKEKKLSKIIDIIKGNTVYKIIFFITCILIILGIALICAGGTFSFFAAREEASGSEIGGQSTGLGLEMTVELLSNNANSNLIPLDSDTTSLNTAIKGYNNNTNRFDNTKSCIDKNGYSVCKVYKINVKNKSTNKSDLTGGILSLSGNQTPNVTCAVMQDTLNVKNNNSCVGADTLVSNGTIGAGETLSYYIIIYIKNLNEPQTDVGLFEGSIVFTSRAGAIIEEEFS